MTRKPKIATNLPPPKKVSNKEIKKAIQEAKQWHDAVDRATENLEVRSEKFYLGHYPDQQRGKMKNKKYDVTQFFAKKEVLDHGHVEFFDGMIQDPLLKIVNSARVSFAKESKSLSQKDEKLIRFLYKHEHYSTFRHTYFSFRVKAPLCVFRQWWKYQIGSHWNESEGFGSIEIPETNWNEASGRYIKFKPEFYIPNEIRRQSKDNKQGSHGKIDSIFVGDLELDPVEFFKARCLSQYNAYLIMEDNGCAKEQIRMLLPQNIYSECVWTCSLQTIIYFLHQRLKSDAQKEIREYAKAIYDLVKPMLWALDGHLKIGE